MARQTKSEKEFEWFDPDKNHVVIGIDPGLCTGVAAFVDGRYRCSTHIEPIGSCKNFSNVCDSLGDALFDTLYGWKYQERVIPSCSPSNSTILIEYPSFWRSPKASVAAATGSIIKLSVICGTLLGVANGVGFGTVGFVPVNVWKGQLSKDVVKKRIMDYGAQSRDRDLLAYSYKNHNETDAIGIALFALGKINQ